MIVLFERAIFRQAMPGAPILIGGMNLDVQVVELQRLLLRMQINLKQTPSCLTHALQAVPALSYTTQPGGTVPGKIMMTSGGVARNVAECLASLLG